jgi:hypothetical protein
MAEFPTMIRIDEQTMEPVDRAHVCVQYRQARRSYSGYG